MRIVFMGTPGSAVVSLRSLISGGHDIAAVYTQPDKPVGRGNRIKESPVGEAAAELGLKVMKPKTLRTPEAEAEFSSHNADGSVVVAYGKLLPGSFLTAFPKGATNVHFSLLPKYRGAAPVNWAIANGETETGVTTMQMDLGLDTGDILLQRSTPIGPDETAIELLDRLSKMGAELLLETLRDLEVITKRPQDGSQASFAPILKRSDGKIDWAMDAISIRNRIRGFQPFPGSFTDFRGKRISIWRATSGSAANARPGTITKVEKEAFEAACGGNTSLRILELQIEGKRRSDAGSFINGSRPQTGEMFA